jgi:hypothetical protein
MIAFDDSGGQVVLVYSPEQSGPSWLDKKLESEGDVTLSRTFTVRKDDLLGRASHDGLDSLDEDVRRFVIGTVDDEYRTIRKGVLGLKHDLLIAGSIGIRQRTFIAERNISIFRRIDEMLDEQIVVGGPRLDAIPEDEFARLLHDFPTSTEVTHYARTRIARVLREYFDTMSDAETRLMAYMVRRERSGLGERAETHGRIHVASELEREKFTYVRGRLAEMLDDAEGYLEDDWQTAVADLFLLIFPQYVAVLHKVHVTDQHSKESKSTNRYIDLMLVGADGHVDIIEIKRPRPRDLVSPGVYRGNHVPARELSGSIMQAERYLFYLGKSGRDGERKITTKHRASLPAGLDVRITNPKAIILAGRDNNLSAQERFDFEFARRQYSNVVDVISYDDLMRRLDNVIIALTKRVGAQGDPGPDDQIGVSA